MKKLSLAVLLLVAAMARSAIAAEDPKKLFESATAEFNLGHYEKAASMYEEIYKITLEPVLLYNIAQAHRLGGDLEKAVFFYKGFLRAQPNAQNRPEVQKRIGELQLAIEAKRRSQERPPNVPAGVEPGATHAPPEPASVPTPTAQPPPASAAAPPAEPAPSTTSPEPSNTLVATSKPAEKPLTKKPWFWAVVGVGAVVVAGVAIGLGVGLSSPSNPTPRLGTVTVH